MSAILRSHSSRPNQMLRRLLLITLGLIVGLVGYLKARDPEHLALDATTRAQALGAFFTLRDGATHYKLEGPETGQRVMLVHGFSVPSYIWDSTAVALTVAGYRVARYDTFGRGFSDRPDTAYDLELFERQLTDMLDSLGWREPVHLMGLSFGGPITAGFTSRHPERVKSLTLVDPAAGTMGGVPWYMSLPVVGELLWQAMAVPGMADGQLTDFVAPAKWPDWPDRYRVQMQYAGFGRALLRTRIAAAGTVLDSLYAAAGRTQKPALLIWGKEDQTVPIAMAEGIKAAIPQIQFHAVDKAGHLPHMERTDVVNPLLLDFLRTQSDSTTTAPTPR